MPQVAGAVKKFSWCNTFGNVQGKFPVRGYDFSWSTRCHSTSACRDFRFSLTVHELRTDKLNVGVIYSKLLITSQKIISVHQNILTSYTVVQYVSTGHILNQSSTGESDQYRIHSNQPVSISKIYTSKQFILISRSGGLVTPFRWKTRILH